MLKYSPMLIDELESSNFVKVPVSDSTSEKKSSWFLRSMKSELLVGPVADCVVIVVFLVVVIVVVVVVVEGPVVFDCAKLSENFSNDASKSSSNSNSSSL